MKVPNNSLLLIAFFFLRTIYASDDLWYFGSGQGDWPRNLLNDIDGNLFISGHCYAAFEGIPNRDPSNTTADAFLFKVTPTHEIIWKITFGTSGEERVSSFCYSSDGNILVAGFTTGNFTTGFPSPFNDKNMFLAKFSILDGTQIWNVTFGEMDSDDVAEGVADADGNIFLSADSDGSLFGDTSCSTIAYTNIWVLKLDSQGTLLNHTCFGTSLFDKAQQIAIHGSSVYVCGSTNGTFAGNTAGGLTDIWAAKVITSPSLSLDWVTQVGSVKEDDGYDIAVDSQENFVFVAGTISGDIPQESQMFAGFTDYALLKFSTADGSYLGASTGGGLLLESFVDVFIDADGFIYATGYTTAPILNAVLIGNVDGLIVKFDPDSLEGLEAWISGDDIKYDTCFGSLLLGSDLYCVGTNSLTASSFQNTQGFLADMQGESAGKKEKSGNTVAIAVGVSVGGAALLGAFAGGFLIFKKKQSQHSKERTPKNDIPLVGVVEISDIQIHEKLGSGNFGDVFRGTWQGTTPCALKKLKNPDMASEFMNEAMLLQQLSMPNVVRFFGVFKDAQKNQYLVTEFMSKGALNVLLQENHDKLTDLDLLLMARDATAGMQYLASKGIIHRDLSARNLLVKEEEGRLAVKVADFGLSRAASEYYQSSGSTFPVKWSAPEVLNYSKYSSQSDVWSFGIVLWEIFELGRVPYTGKTNDETIQLVLGGYRLPAPKICPQGIYELMQKCWQTDPSARPTFAAIYENLTDILKKSGWQTQEGILAQEDKDLNNNTNCTENALTEPIHKTVSEDNVYFSKESEPQKKSVSEYKDFEE